MRRCGGIIVQFSLKELKEFLNLPENAGIIIIDVFFTPEADLINVKIEHRDLPLKGEGSLYEHWSRNKFLEWAREHGEAAQDHS